MASVECPREQDVLDALASGRWPLRCDDDLRTHVAHCAVCADFIEVVQPLSEAHDALWSTIRVPSPGTVWWRAQLRARQEAARRASRPIAVAQVVAGVAALGAIYTIAPWLAPFSSVLPQLPSLEFSTPELPALRDLSLWSWGAIVALVTWAVIAPLIIYLTVAED